MRSFLSISTLIFGFLTLTSGLGAQERVDWETVSRIRDEGLNRSQVMDLVGYMSDVLGPRLTASPSMRRAQEWAREKMGEVGLENVNFIHLPFEDEIIDLTRNASVEGHAAGAYG